MIEDKFLMRLRDDARRLQYSPDDLVVNRISGRIRARLSTPGVAELLARWFRPIAASLAALAIAGAVALGVAERGDDALTYDDSIEISVAGESYRVE
jgi:hypothetical protein